MVGMGSKILKRPEDLPYAIKLTEGCVWSYMSTATGIMPETFTLATCKGEGNEVCPWNEPTWYSYISPPSDTIIAAAAKHDVILSTHIGKKKRNLPEAVEKVAGPPGSPVSHVGLTEDTQSRHVTLTEDGGAMLAVQPFADVEDRPPAPRIGGSSPSLTDPDTAAPVEPAPVVPALDPYEQWLK